MRRRCLHLFIDFPGIEQERRIIELKVPGLEHVVQLASGGVRDYALLAGGEVKLTDEILDRIDAVVAPGTDSGAMGATYEPPAMTQTGLRRRPLSERAAV